MGPYYSQEPPQAFPQLVQILWFLVRLQDTAQQQPRGNFDINKDYYSHILRATQDNGQCGEGEGAQNWASAFIGVQRVG